MMKEQKRHERERLMAKRRAVSRRKEKNELIFKSLVELINKLGASDVFAYCSVGTEVDTLSFIEYALKSSVRLALPVCDKSGRSMSFYYINSLSDLCEGEYNIPKPSVEKCEMAISSENSVCLVPGLGFDQKGARLGYGGGYYDRFLPGFCGRTVGLCYEDCLVPSLPAEPTDICVDYIITNERVITLPPSC